MVVNFDYVLHNCQRVHWLACCWGGCLCLRCNMQQLFFGASDTFRCRWQFGKKKKNNCANSFYEMLLFTWNERWTRFISEKKIIYIYENLLYSLLCSICVGFIWVFGFNSIKAFTSLLNRKIKVKSFRIAFFFFSSRLFYIYICKKQKANKKTKYYSFIANVWI